MRRLPPPSAERIRELFDCDPLTGVLITKTRRSNRNKIGAPAGCPNKNGYLRVCVDGRLYYAHHLVWLHVTGEWPGELDHWDGDHAHNWMSNLRDATRSQNMANQQLSKRNTSGFKGTRKTAFGTYQATLGVNGQTLCFGTYETPTEANAAYLAAARKYYGDFARGM